MIQQSFWRQWTGRIFSKQWWPTHIIPVEKIWVAWRCILRACYVQCGMPFRWFFHSSD